jgi:3-methyladenine DNA glycosylase/8-oxoguanine DNA glycosylase
MGRRSLSGSADESQLTEKQIDHDRQRARRGRSSTSQAFAKVDDIEKAKWLYSAPIGEIDAWLRKIWGVGDFASGFILYRGLGRARSLPWSDMFVRAAKATYPGTTRKDLEKRAEAYGPWKGHWALYLLAVTLT